MQTNYLYLGTCKIFNQSRQLDRSDINSEIVLIHLANIQKFAVCLNFAWIP